MNLLNGFIRVEQQQQQRKWSGGKCKFRLRKRPCQIRWGVTAYENVQFIFTQMLDVFIITSLLPAAASDAAAVAIHGSERGMAKMRRSSNWKLDDRKLSRRKFFSWRDEKFRDVNFPSRTTESCPNVNRPSRTRRVVKMRIFCQKFILRIEVRCRINRIL